MQYNGSGWFISFCGCGVTCGWGSGTFLSCEITTLGVSLLNLNFFAMIDKTGVVGVHFPGCIRYAVCADIAAMEEGLRKAFQAADVAYEWERFVRDTN